MAQYTPDEVEGLKSVAEIAIRFGAARRFEKALKSNGFSVQNFLTGEIRVMEEGTEEVYGPFYECPILKSDNGLVALVLPADCMQEPLALAGQGVWQQEVEDLIHEMILIFRPKEDYY